ncbi:hypothetical protein AVEN_175895-1 [Araneus ventricosus]|uniref:Mariner Mos1 transposase n=1 Tax=Araneus ventricosus TaxID=182803 RepID=A0A4Y2ECD9_ARAVE|nr:hypothetical protein AVEN_175895-1 [Araneus ventricosus]
MVTYAFKLSSPYSMDCPVNDNNADRCQLFQRLDPARSLKLALEYEHHSSKMSPEKETLFTTNLFLKARLSIKNFTWRRLRDSIRRKRPEKWAINDWLLLHDNAPPHHALIVKKYLARHSVTTMEHPPYSPDLAPADFYLFLRLKMKLKGHRFVDSDEVIENAMKHLKDLSKNGCQECFDQLYER